MSLLAFALLFVGLSTLCLCMPRHGQQLSRLSPSPPQLRRLTALAWGVLSGSLVPAIAGYGVSIGVAVWFGLFSVATLAIGLMLTYRPKLLAALAPMHLLRALRAFV